MLGLAEFEHRAGHALSTDPHLPATRSGLSARQQSTPVPINTRSTTSCPMTCSRSDARLSIYVPRARRGSHRGEWDTLDLGMRIPELTFESAPSMRSPSMTAGTIVLSGQVPRARAPHLALDAGGVARLQGRRHRDHDEPREPAVDHEAPLDCWRAYPDGMAPTRTRRSRCCCRAGESLETPGAQPVRSPDVPEATSLCEFSRCRASSVSGRACDDMITIGRKRRPDVCSRDDGESVPKKALYGCGSYRPRASRAGEPRRLGSRRRGRSGPTPGATRAFADNTVTTCEQWSACRGYDVIVDVHCSRLGCGSGWLTGMLTRNERVASGEEWDLSPSLLEGGVASDGGADGRPPFEGQAGVRPLLPLLLDDCLVDVVVMARRFTMRPILTRLLREVSVSWIRLGRSHS